MNRLFYCLAVPALVIPEPVTLILISVACLVCMAILVRSVKRLVDQMRVAAPIEEPISLPAPPLVPATTQ